MVGDLRSLGCLSSLSHKQEDRSQDQEQGNEVLLNASHLECLAVVCGGCKGGKRVIDGSSTERQLSCMMTKCSLAFLLS